MNSNGIRIRTFKRKRKSRDDELNAGEVGEEHA